ncbi:MAG: TRAP transporter substrate-binding protein DctP [Proteobacteria bacterium]|nr:TRAP transporter substrate-binding protein DctP [Pseudomonadota bacterium]
MYKKILMLFTMVCTITTFSVTKSYASTNEIKFAVLAPEGSTWLNLMRQFSEQITKETKGQITYKIFPGGISGDEFDVIRKMRIGKIDSAGFTGVGLGQILPSIRVLELPRLFSSYKEIDYVTAKMRPYFEKELDKKGYILLGWAEVGFVNMFSNKPLDSLNSLEGVKMWAWEGDPLAKELFEKLKIVPNPMPVTDVFTSLQTGLINAVYVSPLAAIALQWFTRTKYMNTLKLTNATGAILMTKNSFNKLSPAHQKLLRERSDEFCKRLVEASRRDNDKAYDTLKRNNIKFVDMNEQDIKKFDQISEQVWKSLTGKLYSRELLDQVLKYREEFKSSAKNTKSPKK